MVSKISFFVATSLDGFIAKKDGSIDWIKNSIERFPSNQDNGYQTFIESIDIIVMGRNTFETVITLDKWPYENKQVMVLTSMVLTSMKLDIPLQLNNKVSVSSASPTELINKLSNENIKNVYVDGGITIQNFLSCKLVDEITITIFPIILGEGRPLFGPVINEILLEPIKKIVFDNRFVQLKYRIIK